MALPVHPLARVSRCIRSHDGPAVADGVRDCRPQQRQACAEAGRDIWAHQGTRHVWSRLCASQVYGRDSLLGVGEGQKRGEGLGAHPGPWHVLVPCFLGLGHSRRSIAGEPLPAVGVEFRRLGEGLVWGGGRSAMPWMLQSRASWCPVQPLDFFIYHHPLKS